MKAVQFGAGSIGRGFIADLLHDSGYTITFIDVNEKLNKQINRTNNYSLYVIEENYREKVINNVQAYSPITEHEKCINEIIEADIITTSVWADNLGRIAPLLLEGLKERVLEGRPKINILACENAVENSELLKKELEKLDSDFVLDNAASFPNTAVDRLVLESERNNEMVIDIGQDHELVIEENNLVNLSTKPIRHAEYTNDLMKYLERKLYIINCGHAWAGYMGHLHGLTIIQDVFRNDQFVEKVKEVMMESGELISTKYDFSLREIEDYVDFSIRRFQTPGITDTIARVSRSPIRKLQPVERLVGPTKQCEKYGLKNERLIQGIAAAFLYDWKEDSQSIELQSYIQNDGINKAITHFTQIEEDTVLFEKIVNQYNHFKKEREA